MQQQRILEQRPPSPPAEEEMTIRKGEVYDHIARLYKNTVAFATKVSENNLKEIMVRI